MQKIIDYTIVVSSLPKGFAVDIHSKNPIRDEIVVDTPFGERVKEHIDKGWQPLGRPFVILDQRWAQINQAMVKYAPPAKLVEQMVEAMTPEQPTTEQP